MKHYLLGLGLLCSTTATLAQLAPAARLPELPGRPRTLQAELRGPQQAPAPRSTTVRRPRQRISYVWNSTTRQWSSPTVYTSSYAADGQPSQAVVADSATKQLQARLTYSYNAFGSQTLQLGEVWTGSAWQNDARTVQVFDSQNNFISGLEQRWVGGSWQNISQRTATYDSRNSQTSYVAQDWINGAWVTNYGSRTAYTYNTTGQYVQTVEESFDIPTKTYVTWGRNLYTYLTPTDTRYSRVDAQAWQNGAYVNSSQTLLTFDAQQRLSLYESRSWNGTAWVPSSRITYAYGAPQGSYQVTSESYRQGSWVNTDRTTISYDTNGNVTKQENEVWQNGAWMFVYGLNYLLRYNPSGDIIRQVEQEFDPTSKAFENRIMSTYSDFQSITLGVQPNAALAAHTQLYPNPTIGSVTLELAEATSQAAVPAEVVNSLGQVVQRLTLQPRQGSAALDLSRQPAGLYTVHLHTSAGLVVKKVVRQ